MAETKKERLIDILKDLRTSEIEGSMIVARDGLEVASDLIEEGFDRDSFAAMSAAMQGAAETAMYELKQGEINQIIVDAKKGRIISVSSGKKTILVALIKPEGNLGLVLIELEKAAEKIGGILE